jgi:hypothetical protein
MSLYLARYMQHVYRANGMGRWGRFVRFLDDWFLTGWRYQRHQRTWRKP